MEIVQKCKHCQEELTVDSNLIGATIVCPHCKEKIIVKIEKNNEQNSEQKDEWKVTTGPQAHHVTVEQTSKDLKAGCLIAGLGLIIGLFVMFSEPQVGLVIVGISVLVGVLMRILIWWNHG